MARILTAGAEFGNYEGDDFRIWRGPVTTSRVQPGRSAKSPQGNGGRYYYYLTNDTGVEHDFEPNIPAGIDEAYIRFHYNSGNRCDGTWELLRLTNPAGGVMLRLASVDLVSGSIPGGPFYFAFYNSAGSLFTSNSSFGFTNSQEVWHTVEIHVKFAGSGARVRLRVNGREIIDWTGSLVGPVAETVFHRLRFNNDLISGGGTAFRGYDDIAVNDTSGPINNSWIGEGYVLPFYPNGNGSTTNLVNSERTSTDNFKFLNRRREDNPTAFVSPTVAGDKDTYTIPSPPSEFHGVNALRVSTNVVRHGTAITQANLLLQPPLQAEIASAPLPIPQGGDGYITANFDNNPNTSNAPFTIAEIEGMETGIGFIA